MLERDANFFKQCQQTDELSVNNRVAIPILLFFLLGKPFERGFHCDDQSLRYPYKDSTIHTAVLYVVGTSLPGFSMLGLEYWRCRTESVGQQVSVRGRSLPPFIWAWYSTIGTFLFGCACSQLLTDVAKYSIGRLRPHFLDICQPDWSQINCTDPYRYIDPIPCTSTNSHRMKEARLSFPSGHASFSAFTMVYFVIYLQMRYKFRTPKLVRPFIQFVCLMMTFYTSLSRVSDYKHHWSDVFSGFLLGTTVAVLILFFSLHPSFSLSPSLSLRPPCSQLKYRTCLVAECNPTHLAVIWRSYPFATVAAHPLQPAEIMFNLAHYVAVTVSDLFPPPPAVVNKVSTNNVGHTVFMQERGVRHYGEEEAGDNTVSSNVD
ncbi:hypothetical protein Pmani_016919 [Petrolisthes manimaculis]|uniref:Phosphatidic acid phosphatase type 2/haloperoxidase domain-containing protein n=1 Tax=Petrolisthes manimaculis TaxID=1843537 RepID=A0AAE1PQQ8_9EUCA|nr:hypothetical protein Pmani_016919 [Petrolisthes manimaculis]